MKRKCAVLISVLFMFVSLHLCADTTRAKVGIIPIMNSTGDELYDALCLGMNDTLTVAFTFLTQFDVEIIPGLDPFDNREDTVRYYKLKKLDYVIYGRAVLDEKGKSTLYIGVYDRAEDKVDLELKEELRGSVAMFETADGMIEEVVRTFSTIHLGFGSLLFVNSGVKGRYRVSIDNISMGENIEELKAVPVGPHSILISQERMFGSHTLARRDVLVEEDIKSTIGFRTPLLTDKEKAQLDVQEAFIKKNWYVPENRPELLTTFDDLQLLLTDVSYAEDLVQKKAEYMVWQDIFDAGGEIPGVVQPQRPVYNHWGIDISGGSTFLTGKAGTFLKAPAFASFSFRYYFVLPWGDIGIGGRTGIRFQSTDNDTIYIYNMSTIPLGVSVTYTTGFESSWFGFAEFAAGYTLSSVNYQINYPDRVDAYVLAPFTGGELGGGVYINDMFGIQLFCRISATFYHDVTVLGISPGGGVKIAL